MTKPPLLSGQEVVKVFQKLGFYIVGQKGSHIKIHNDSRQITLIIPNHKEVDRWTLKGILKDAEIPAEEFIKFLS